MTFVAVATQAVGKYCHESLNPAFADVWVCLTSVLLLCLETFLYHQRSPTITDGSTPWLNMSAFEGDLGCLLGAQIVYTY